MREARDDQSVALSRLEDVLSRHLPNSVPVVAVPMANNPEVIGAVAAGIQRRLAEFVLIGPLEETRALVTEAGADPSGATIVDERDPVAACDRAAQMAADGDAHVLMKGLVQTSDFLRAILNRERGLVGPGGLLSHVALCDVGGFDRLFLMSDGAVTTYPNVIQKRAIVENALHCAAAIGWSRPRVALIAPVEKVSDKVPSTTEAAAVREHFQSDRRLYIDGPFGLDVAISPEAAAIKGIGGDVAGVANVLIVANIDAGNVFYKSLTGFAHARIAGIVAGAAVPVVLTSRADSEESKLRSLQFALAVSAAAG